MEPITAFAPLAPVTNLHVLLFDPAQDTAAFLKPLGVQFTLIDSLAGLGPKVPVVIGEDAWTRQVPDPRRASGWLFCLGSRLAVLSRWARTRRPWCGPEAGCWCCSRPVRARSSTPP